jgi:GTP pyrophosphokinase
MNLGQELLHNELKNSKTSLNAFIQEINENSSFLENFKINTLDELFYQIGSAKVSAKNVARIFAEKTGKFISEEELIEKIPKEAPKEKIFLETTKDIIVVEGTKDVLFHLAQCCKPIPGDEIIGYITRGKGISVHRIDCPNLKDLDSERFVEVRWGRYDNRTYPVHLYIICLDRKGLLANISSAIAAAESNILKAEVRTTSDKKAFFEFYIEVNNKNHLDKIISNIYKIEGVLNIERRLG